MDKVISVTENGDVSNFEYYPDGQLATNCTNDHEENFYWDGLALIKRDDVNYTVEPAVTGGNAIIASTQSHNDAKILFNDMLGSSLGSVGNGEFSSIERDSFGETSVSLAALREDFFTGKPNIEGLGYTFLFRNYKPEIGKWATSDPLGYPDGWNNLAYCNNWVMVCIDKKGDHIYHVVDSESTDGLGHSGAILGSPEFGYHIMNHGGGNTDPDVVHSWSNKYDTLVDALHALNDGREAEASFDRIQRFDATPGQDDVAYQQMLESASEGFDWLTNNCWDVIEDGLDAANIDRVIGNLYPNQAFNVNAGQTATVLDFNKVWNGLAE